VFSYGWSASPLSTTRRRRPSSLMLTISLRSC
jgi:hypothetical protein